MRGLFLLVVVFVVGVFGAFATVQAAPTFEEMFERHGTVMLLIDPATGEIEDANPAAVAFYGYSRDQMRSMKIQDINALTAEQVAAERALAAKENRNFFIFRHRLKDGSVRTVEVYSHPFSFGARQLLFSIVRDISKQRELQDDLWHYQARLEEMVDRQSAKLDDNTQWLIVIFSLGGIFLTVLVVLLWNALRRQKDVQAKLQESKLRYKEIVERTQDLIGRLDGKGNFIYVNHMSERVLGVAPDDAIGRSIFEFIHPDDKDKTKWELASWVEFKQSNAVLENRLIGLDGKTHIMLWTINLSFGDDGRLDSVTGIGRDITLRVEAESALEQAMREAERANRAKSEFLASMSHELRTPLNAVLGFAQMLRLSQETPLSKKQEEYVDNIEAGGEHLLQLVGDILDLAKIEADQIRLFLEYVDPKTVVDECVSLVRHLASQRNISVENGFVAKVMPMVRADPVRMKQGLINLLTNAVRYNVENGKVIVTGAETGDGFIRICVEDTGIGISQESHSDVFGIFQRLNHDPSRASGGAGIGLAVTKQLIERMGGRIDFESEEGKGSKFWIDVPLASNQETLVWADNLSVRVAAIDADHKELIRLINEAGEPGLGPESIKNISTALIDYTLYHFKREETIMETCAYPGIQQHKERHRALEAKAKAFQLRIEAGDTTAANDLRSFLREWLVSHIMKVDRLIYESTVGREDDIERALKNISISE